MFSIGKFQILVGCNFIRLKNKLTNEVYENNNVDSSLTPLLIERFSMKKGLILSKNCLNLTVFDENNVKFDISLNKCNDNSLEERLCRSKSGISNNGKSCF